MTSVQTTWEQQDWTKSIGSELRNVQLAELDGSELERIKALAAERGVLFFRDQEMTLSDQADIGRRLGELHTHPAVSAPEGFPEVVVVHADADSTIAAGESWHTDVSCDERPPALSMLKIETTPSVGGDTLWSSMYEAFETLSSDLQSFLMTLTATHSGEYAYRGSVEAYNGDSDTVSPTKMYPVSAHPVVRTHPTTKRKALYVNSGFTERINGLHRAESDSLLRMLFDHIAYGVNAQVRFRWEPNSVALWDNRCVQHHASWDYFPETRHGYRITTLGEQPFLD